ncbi:PilZ domain-containing protein [Mesoterricola sediminis]|uniref:PilZ domain-containing protein n=1 Tax=Mesoterricola sediminis TaxID=2927980 RepID=A0AA48GWX6_9BACT|nr:PilZ domain-containing protein [Mesoterricola sediminis]BDU75915.1 hypothetical protein METESE_08730 [Mesoterricola sediminis]
MSSPVDKRRHERLPAHGEIRIKGKGRLGIYAVVLNVSLGGVLLSATPSLPVGSQWNVSLRTLAAQRVQAMGTVVRNDDGGTALKFAQELSPSSLKILTGAPEKAGGVISAYLTYFQVGRNERNAGCEHLLGVSRRTFKTVFYSTFSASLPLAVAPVWFARAAFQPWPVWLKISLSFLYAGFWLFVLQPTMDVAILGFIRKLRAAKQPA